MSDPANSIIMPLYESKGWLKLMGVMSIIGGALYCLSIVGIIIGWLPIWMGVLAWQAADRLDRGVQTNDLSLCAEGSKKLSSLITIMGVLTLISLVMTILIMAILIIALVGGLAMANGG